MIKQWCLAVAACIALAGAAHAAVDVNSADEAALTTVRGIGPATAKSILEERAKHGPYKNADDLAERVRGIGPKSVARLQEAGLTIGAKGAPAATSGATPAATPAAAKTAGKTAAGKVTR